MSTKNDRHTIKVWIGAAFGLYTAGVILILWAAYLVYITPPRIVNFMIGIIEFIVIADVITELVMVIFGLLNKIPTFFGWALLLL